MLFAQTQVMAPSAACGSANGPADPDTYAAERRHDGSRSALEILDRHLAERTFLAADRYTIADIAVLGYAHVAGEAAIDLAEYPAVQRWIGAATSTPGFMNDLAPYPANARSGASRSIYDS